VCSESFTLNAVVRTQDSYAGLVALIAHPHARHQVRSPLFVFQLFFVYYHYHDFSGGQVPIRRRGALS
jgi:hypothetical protein